MPPVRHARRPAPRWSPTAVRPGQRGFNAHVRRLLRTSKTIRRTMSCRVGEDRWYQNVLSFLMQRGSPVQRLLVVWQLGSGKTIGILRVLDAYYDDPRPKVMLFPTRAVLLNFYEELGKHPSRLRRKIEAALAQRPDLRDVRFPDATMDVQERARCVGRLMDFLSAFPRSLFGGRNAYSGLSSPFRAFTFDEVERGVAQGNAIFNWHAPEPGWRRTGMRLFSKVVLAVDEAQGLLRFARCAEYVTEAVDSVVALFTATPFLTGRGAVDESRRLLTITKGRVNARGNDEGFVSVYVARPAALFARKLSPAPALPDLPPFRDEPEVRDFPRAWLSLLPQFVPVAIDVADRLWPLWLRVAAGPRAGRRVWHAPPAAAAATSLSVLEHLTSEADVLAARDVREARAVAPKLVAIARHLQREPLKTLVLIHEEHGPAALAHLLTQFGVSHVLLTRPTGSDATVKRHADANRLRMAQFNADDNRDGGRIQVAVAVAEEFGEGVTFRHVGQVVLVALSAGDARMPSWPALLQMAGRAWRSCSHEGLPREQRTLVWRVFVAVAADRRTLDHRKLLYLLGEVRAVQEAMEALADLSVDADLYDGAQRPWYGRLFDRP